jgi:hypothetical protein
VRTRTAFDFPARGPGSFTSTGWTRREPRRAGYEHGGPRRRVRERDEDGVFYADAWGCGYTVCGLCLAIDRARRGPLCGWMGPEGARCMLLWGHAHPGDHAMCPVTGPDHVLIDAAELVELERVLGEAPWAPAPAKEWVRGRDVTWNDARFTWTRRTVRP